MAERKYIGRMLMPGEPPPPCPECPAKDDIIARVMTYSEHLMAEGGDRAAVGETIVRLIEAGPNRQAARAAKEHDDE